MRRHFSDARRQINIALKARWKKENSAVGTGVAGGLLLTLKSFCSSDDQAYLAAGQGSAAAAEFQILDHSGIVFNCWTGALAHVGVARANALDASTSQGADADAARVRALAAYKDFLTLWKDADPDIPIRALNRTRKVRRDLEP